MTCFYGFCYMRIKTLTIIASLLFAVVNGDGEWESAHATFYGDAQGGGTMQGACGYGNLIDQGYGLETTALSNALFNNGSTCGACYEIKCVDSTGCHPDVSIKVTATNVCPPGGEGWCNPPNQHFDLTQPMFLKIAEYKSGIVPVQFRRVSCIKQGGIKFELSGNPNFLLVTVYNVGGVGDVHGMSIKGPDGNWIQMSRNWGQKWQTGEQLVGKSLSFQVTTSDGKMVQSDDVAPSNWEFGKTYEGKQF
ncbi:hypothetical protein MKW94_001748 [Papaver nudicaule]|uniref:Expansin n=1 Tax=Papaver nudicaule TaxID=74823 RepID=A0AA41UZZ7_PAPNU|nr:hypothetical protein [Papaver nudicaule]